MGVRRRSSDIRAFETNWSHTDSWFPQYNTSGSFALINHSLCLDVTHPSFFRPGGTDGDNGSGCDISSTTYTTIEPAPRKDKSWDRQHNYGSVVPWQMQGGIPPDGTEPLSPKSDIDLFGQGATAISRCTPTNPAFGLSRALGEIRNDGIPSMIGFNALKDKARNLRSSRAFGKTSGNEFLNVEFGWAPFVSDLQGFARSVKSSNKIIAQHHKSADRKIKRRYSFPKFTTRCTYVGGCFVQPYEIMGGQMWQGVQTITSFEQTSFSGAFRYHVPLGDDLPSKMMTWESEANKLLGSRLTPKLVWDLAPWTWAADWFSNAGDVINNISRLGSDGLLLQYGYIASKYSRVDDMSAKLDYDGNPYWYENCRLIKVDSILKRRAARWWGFNLDISALSPAQDAVVVALGLSHGLR